VELTKWRRLSMAGLLSLCLGFSAAVSASFELVSQLVGEPQLLSGANGGTSLPSLSADGRFVAFASSADNLVAEDSNGKVSDIFVYDRDTGITELLTAGGNRNSTQPFLSADGRFVVFESSASNLVAAESSADVSNIFLHDRDSDTTTLVTIGGDDDSRRAAISADGRFVAFESRASNLVANDSNGLVDIFIYDTLTEATELLARGGNSSGSVPALSSDGRFVAFTSDADDLASADSNGSGFDIFVIDRETDSIELITAGGNGDSTAPSISADGRHVAFVSRASNLAAGDSNGGDADVFVHNREADTTKLLTAGGNADSFASAISADGQFVAIFSAADNLVAENSQGLLLFDLTSDTIEVLPGSVSEASLAISADGHLVAFATTANDLVESDVNNNIDTFVFNRVTNELERVHSPALGFDAVGGNGPSARPSVSGKGRFVAYESAASNLVESDSNGATDIFIYDTESGRNKIFALGANGNSNNPAISTDGRFVVFDSEASNIGGGTSNDRVDIFVYNQDTGVTDLLTAVSNNRSANPAISEDGRFVAFQSFASNLVVGDSNGSSPDIFVFDRQTGSREILTAGGNTVFLRFPLLDASPSISADGRFVAFQSTASNLVGADINGEGFDIFVFDRDTATVERLTSGNGHSLRPSISADGRFVAFQSSADNLVAGDLNGSGDDVFLYDRQTSTTERLTPGANTQAIRPSISGDGRFVTFTLSSVVQLNSGDFNRDDIAIFDRDSNSYGLVTDSADFDSDLSAISADGQRIAFSSAATNLTNDAIASGQNVFVSLANNPPSVDALATTTVEDTPVALTLTGFDPDSNPLTFEVVAAPGNGELSGAGPDYIYTPEPDFFGTDSFSFAASDGSSISLPATVTIEVGAVNDAPVAVGADAGIDLTTLEDTALAITLVGTDIEGDALTYDITTPPGSGTLTGTAPALKYSPAVNFSGSDEFSFAVSDGALSSTPVSVKITVVETNDVPAADSQFLATAPNTPLEITLTGSDPDSTGLGFAIVGFPANGSLSGNLPDLVYTPVREFTGTDIFTFIISDGRDSSAVASVSVTVAVLDPPANQPPVADAQSITAPLNTPVSVLLHASDAEDDPLTFNIVELPANGKLSGVAPDLTYTPDANYLGTDSFSFTVSDTLVESAPVPVSISIVDATIELFSAVLPASRSVEVGATATAFATLINAGSITAQSCSLRLPDSVPADFFYQASDAVTNQVMGQPNLAVDLPAGASQSFVIGITPVEELAAVDIALQFQCANATDAASFVGLNTLLLSASFAPVPDLIALVATTSNNGVMELDNNTGFFTAATVNVGSAATITVTADTGQAALPMALSLCQTDPATSACINPSVPATEPVLVDIGAGDSPTFAVFASADAAIALDPANSRVFLRFSDELGEVRGSTSVAVANNQ